MDCIDKINDIQKRGPLSHDFVLYDATLRNLQTLAESTKRLPESVKELNPSIDWKNIAGFRNIVVHDYLGEIDPQTIEKIIQTHLPLLKEAITQMVGDSPID